MCGAGAHYTVITVCMLYLNLPNLSVSIAFTKSLTSLPQIDRDYQGEITKV